MMALQLANLWRRMRGEPKASNLRSPAQWLIDALGGGQTTTKVHVNEATALSASAVFACVRAISEDVAKVPLVVNRIDRRSGVKSEAFTHSLYSILRLSPSTDMNSLTCRRTVTMGALLWGNGFAEIVRDVAGRVVALLPIHPSRVTVERNDEGRIVYKVINDDGRLATIAQANMLHIQGIGCGVVGYSILKLGKEAIGLMIAAERFAATFFGNGTRLSGVLQHPGHLGVDGIEQLRKSWDEIYSGPNNQNKVAILEENMTFNPTSTAPDNAQMVETRVMSVAEACRFFRVPPHKVFELTRATFSNIEHQSLEYVGDSLYTWFALWDQEIKVKLLNRRGEEDLYPEHQFQNLLMGDMAARSTLDRELFNIGAKSQNEIRRGYGLNPIGPEGDVYYVNAAMVPVEIAMLGPQRTESTAPADDPDDEGDEPTVDMPQRTALKLAAVAARHTDLLAQELSRILALECSRVTAAAKKNGFAQWAESFYGAHAEHVTAKIGAVVDAFCDCCLAIVSDREHDDAFRAAVHAQTKEIGERHAARSVVEMREPATVREWTTARAPSEAAAEIATLTTFIITLAGTPQ